MPFSSRPLLTAAIYLFLSSFVSAHTVITYPGWRGDNLHSYGNVTDPGIDGLGAGPNGTYPYGMQWIYPCGGMPRSNNRTLWPVTGGAVGFQPGWFPGHSSALIYINLGDGTTPANFSMPMQTVFGITGPNNDEYKGSVCMPQVPLPVNYTAVIGQNATIQVIETAQHGAALYNCADITFADPKDVPEVNETNCSNSTDIGFQFVFSTNSLKSDALPSISTPKSWLASIPIAAIILWAFMV